MGKQNIIRPIDDKIPLICESTNYMLKTAPIFKNIHFFLVVDLVFAQFLKKKLFHQSPRK